MPITFTLDFETSQHGVLEIGQPEGVDSAEFTIGKEDVSKLGRDLAFAGGEKTFRIYKNSSALNHDRAFELILYNIDVLGYNSVIKFAINFSEDIMQVGELELGPTFETDRATYVQFNIVQGGKIQLWKNRQDVNVDLFAKNTLDGDDIAPVQTYKLFQRALPSIKRSKWTNPVIPTEIVNDNPAPSPDVFNVIRSNIEYDINNSLSYYEQHQEGDASTFIYLDLKQNTTNINIAFDLDVLFKYRPQERNSLTNGKNAEISLRVRYGNSYDTSTLVTVWQGNRLEGTSDQEYQLPKNLSMQIDQLNATDKVWIFFRSTQGNGAVSRTQFNDSSITISATSTAFSSVFDVVRIYDAMAYVAKYIGGNSINAPRWGVGGEFYNVFITTAQLMRHLNDKPFNLDQKTITEKYLPQVFGGVQINEEGQVYYGRYPDFYRNQEIASFLVEPSEYKVSINERYFCNLLDIKYENFQSQKETEKDYTNDIVHGEAQYAYPNIKGQNTKDVTIGFIFDPQLIETTRIKALSLSDNTATQDDNKIFGIDCIANTNGLIEETQTAFLQHTIEDGKLILRNQNEFDWSILGIIPGSPFRILSGANNFQVNYTVVSVVKNAITLEIASFLTLAGNTGINTRFKFFATSDLINRTNEGFSLIEGLNSNDKTGNLRFTLSRIVRTYYAPFNATVCLNTTGNIKVTKYNNNPDLITAIGSGSATVKSIPIREGGEFRSSSPILTQRLIKAKISASLKEMYQLKSNLDLYRGYIRLIDPKGMPVRVFLDMSKFNIETAGVYGDDVFYGSADIEGEEMYVDAVLNIMSVDGTVLINDEIMPSKHTWDVDQYGKLSIFDFTMNLLFPPTLFNQVSINGKQMRSALEMAKSMSAITPK